MRFWLPLFLVWGLSACASVTQPGIQTISVRTVCEGRLVSNASCLLKNDKGEWSVGSPGSVSISKSYEGLLVRCQKGSSKGENVYVSKNNGGTWGNILIGGGVGYLIDTQSGNGFDYPDSLTVVLQPPCE
ncbi:MAG: hypothetical protein KGL40_02450 [Rhodocyclaceae bacterium]|nr:hypothetical protein [Rhodocyclaceae bacterium]